MDRPASSIRRIRLARWIVHYRDLTRPIPVLDPPRPKLTDAIEEFEFHVVTSASSPVMAQFSEARQKFAASGFKRGDQAFVASYKGRLSGHTWLSSRSQIEWTTGMRLF